MEEIILERQLVIRGRASSTFSTIDKALAARWPYVVQAWFMTTGASFLHSLKCKLGYVEPFLIE